MSGTSLEHGGALAVLRRRVYQHFGTTYLATTLREEVDRVRTELRRLGQ